MANVDYPHGLTPITFGARVRHYEVDSSNTPIIGLHDPVKMENDGHLTLATAGNSNMIGAVVGVYNSDRQPIRYLKTLTAGWLDVMDDPKALFVVQGDNSAGSSAGITAADVGGCADMLATTCNTTTGVSQMELSSTGIQTGTAQLKIIALWLDPANAWGSWADVIVQINEHFFKQEAGI